MMLIKNLNSSIEINEKLYAKVIILIFLFSILFIAGNWSITTQSDHLRTSSNNSTTNVTPAVSQVAKTALNTFTGGFISQGSSGDSAISYFIQSPNMVVGFGTSSVKMLIRDSSSKDQLSYTEITQKFLGSNSVKPKAINPFESHSTYFIGSNVGIVKTEYSTIFYKNLYNNIDLEYTIQNGELKYNFYVNPGGNPASIQLHWIGTPLSLKNTVQGMQITITTHTGQRKLLDKAPISQQKDNGQIIPIRYIIKNADTYAFNVGDYNTNSLLIIDPSFLLYSSFFGGTNYGDGNGIAVDSSDNVYIIGTTSSTDFPAFNVYNSTFVGYSDVFVIKLSASDSSVVYSSFIGGTGFSYGNAIAVDSNGHAYVTGSTSASDFPMINGYNSTYGGSSDVFVLELSAPGSRLMYSIYVGGSNADTGNSIAIDSVGNAYVVGQTYSTNFPMVDPYKSSGGGNYYSAFVFCLGSGGTGMYYSSYFGGSSDDIAYGITLDQFGNAYVTGATASSNFPTTIGAFNRTFSGTYDVFVLKLTYLNYVLSLDYSTFIGGTNSDTGRSIAVDANNNTYVVGETTSPNFPTVNAYNSTYGLGYSAFAFKLSADGSNLVYSTFVGGNKNDWATDIVLDNSGNAYVSGYTSSRNFPITSNAFDNQTPSYTKAVIFELSFSGSSLLYSSYIGGEFSSSYSYALVRDSHGNIYSTGSTLSSDFPITSNAYQNTLTTLYEEMFVFKLAIASVASLTPTQPMVIPSDSTKSLGLIWNAPSFNESFLYYNIYRGTSSGNYTLIGTSTESHFVDYGITAGIIYHYVVAPVYSFGSGYKSADAVGVISILSGNTTSNSSSSSNGLPGFDILSLILLLGVTSLVVLTKRKKK